MKAWLLDKLGDGVDKLHIADVTNPVPAAGEVVLRLLFAGLNPADRYLAENQYPAKPRLPHILGRDGIGVVEAIGERVGGIQIGEKRIILRSEVGVNRSGTFAQQTAVPVESLAQPPAHWSDEQAAGAPLVYLTAYQALTQWTDLRTDLLSDAPPPLVLITGASGGVGVACLQLAKGLNYKVVALSRDRKKSQKLRELGADAVFDPQQPDWRKQMLAEMAGRRVDLAVDNIGGPLFSEVVESLAFGGRISCVGRLAGPVPQFNTASLFFRRAKLGGVHVGSYSVSETQAVWKSILGLLQKTNATPLVDSVHPFQSLPKAFARLKEGPMGKVLLRTSD